MEKTRKFYRVEEIVENTGLILYIITDAKNRSKNTMTESQIKAIYDSEKFNILNHSGYGRD